MTDALRRLDYTADTSVGAPVAHHAEGVFPLT